MIIINELEKTILHIIHFGNEDCKTMPNVVKRDGEEGGGEENQPAKPLQRPCFM